MSVVVATIQGRAQLVRELRNIAGPELRRVAKRTATRSMKPLIPAARAELIQHDAFKTGRLEASIGQVTTDSKTANFVGSRVGIRRDFVFKNASGEKILSTGGGRVGRTRAKKHERALAKGAKHDTVSAQQYARLIHFGQDKSGRVRRKAGPVEFLEKPIVSGQFTIIETVASDLRRHIETTR